MGKKNKTRGFSDALSPNSSKGSEAVRQASSYASVEIDSAKIKTELAHTYKLSDLIGKRAVVLAGGTNAGTVLNALFDPRFKLLKQLVLFSDEVEEEECPYKSVELRRLAFDCDAIVIKSRDRLLDFSWAKGENGNKLKSSPINLPVFNQDGKSFGRVRDIILSLNKTLYFETDFMCFDASALLVASGDMVIFNDSGQRISLPLAHQKPPSTKKKQPKKEKTSKDAKACKNECEQLCLCNNNSEPAETASLLPKALSGPEYVSVPETVSTQGAASFFLEDAALTDETISHKFSPLTSSNKSYASSIKSYSAAIERFSKPNTFSAFLAESENRPEAKEKAQTSPLRARLRHYGQQDKWQAARRRGNDEIEGGTQRVKTPAKIPLGQTSVYRSPLKDSKPKYSFLLGKRLTRDIYDKNERLLLKSGDIITEDAILKAKANNKLVLLALYAFN